MVKMDLSTSEAQASSTSTMALDRTTAYDDLIASMTKLSGAGELKGKAYESAKQYATSVMVPIFQGGILLSEGVDKSVGNLPKEYSSQVEPESLDSDVLEQQIQHYQSLYDAAKSLYDSLMAEEELDLAAISQAETAMSENQKKIDELKEKLRKLLAFDGKSPSLFDSIDGLKSAVEQGLAQASRDFSQFQGSFTIPPASQMQWSQTIGKAWQQRQQELNSQVCTVDFDKKVHELADQTGLTVDEVINYVLFGKEPAKLSKQAHKIISTALKYHRGVKFFDGRPITIDEKGRVKLGSQFLYKKDSGHMYRLTKDFKSATEIDMSKTSFARTADGALDFKEASKMAGKQFKESINPLNDFKGWKDASKLSKVGKGLGIVGTGFTILGNAASNFDESKGGISNASNWGNFAVDTGVDLGTSAGAAAIGAGVGSFFAPPLGTVVGAGVGLGVSWVINKDWTSDEKSSVTDVMKDGIKSGFSGLKGLFA